jgi:calcineurin-like phosphoesterase family protein
MKNLETASERTWMGFIRLAVVGLLLVLSSCVGDEPVVEGGPLDASPMPKPVGAGGGDPVIAAAGDIACNTSIRAQSTCHHEATSDLLVRAGFDWILALGDNQYEEGTLRGFRTYFHSTWGRVKRRIRPTAGNHEYMSQRARGYFRYFGRAAGPPSKGYYSFDIGTWHVVALNSNCAEVSCAKASAQYNWLRRDLAAHDNACTLAFWHHPRWSSGIVHGGSDDVAPLVQALYEFNADVLLVGHEHNYERFAPQSPQGKEDTKRGIREFVVGTGGKDHHPFGPPVPNSEVRNSDMYGVLQLTLHPDSYEWRFVPEAGGAFTDSGRTGCH